MKGDLDASADRSAAGHLKAYAQRAAADPARDGYVSSAVAPSLGRMTSLILLRTNTAMMNRFLAHVAEEFADYCIVMQVDHAVWHRSQQLQIPENLRLMPHLRRSPELHLVEHRWDYLRKHAMRNTLFHSLDKVTNALVTDLRDLAADAAVLILMTFFLHLRMV